MKTLGVCLYPQMSPTQAAFLLSKLPMIRAVNLYDPSKAFYFKDRGYQVGCFVSYRANELPPGNLAGVDWVFLGDEVNHAGPSGVQIDADTYHAFAVEASRRLRAQGYQGIVSAACLAPKGGWFSKFNGAPDMAYIQRLAELERQIKAFDAVGCNPFWTDPRWHDSVLEQHFPGYPIFHAGWGWANPGPWFRGWDEAIAQNTGAWERQLLATKVSLAAVSSLWCLSTYNGNNYPGEWGLVDLGGNLTFSGSKLVEAWKKVGWY